MKHLAEVPDIDGDKYTLADVRRWLRFDGRHEDIPVQGKITMSWTKLAEARSCNR